MIDGLRHNKTKLAIEEKYAFIYEIVLMKPKTNVFK